MSNVLHHAIQQQLLALGRLGWSLRRIEQATQVRRETAGAYLRAAGIPVRGRGGRPAVWPPPNPATTPGVSTDPPPPPTPPSPGRAPGASACEPFRELILAARARGRNAKAIWQDLVDDHGFTARYASVRRFVRACGAGTPVEARVVITTAPGEDLLVLDNDGIVVFGEREGVNAPAMLGARRKLRRHEAAVEDRAQVALDKCLERLLSGELSRGNRLNAFLDNAEQGQDGLRE